MRDRDWIWVAPGAWVIGLAALLCDHFQPSDWLVIGTRTLFGTAACAAICVILMTKARALAGVSPLGLYLFTRLVTRWVYILMYLLAVVRVGLYVYDVTWHCTRFNGADCLGSVRHLEDFQFYVGCCVVPLWVVRAMVLALPFGKSNEQLRGSGITSHALESHWRVYGKSTRGAVSSR